MGRESEIDQPLPFDPADTQAGIEFIDAAAGREDFHAVGRGVLTLALLGNSDELRAEVERSLENHEQDSTDEIAHRMLLGALEEADYQRSRQVFARLDNLPRMSIGGRTPEDL